MWIRPSRKWVLKAGLYLLLKRPVPLALISMALYFIFLIQQIDGQVTLRGLTNCQCRARFRVTFGGNIAVPADGTAGPISLAIAIDGEPINTTTMIYTPTAVSTYGNIFGAIFIDIPRGCCGKVSVRNISTIPVSVQNANLIVERVA